MHDINPNKESKAWKLAIPNLKPGVSNRSKSKAIAKQLRHMTASGQLRAGERLPASREWSGQLGVARGTLVGAIEQLVAEGLLVTRPGSGVYVSEAAQLVHPVESSLADLSSLLSDKIEADIDPPSTSEINFQPGRPSLEAFPRNIWKRICGQAAYASIVEDYGDPAGEIRLRNAISQYMRRSRGLQFDADEIIVTNGAIHAAHLLAQLLLHKGDAVAFEEPGYPLARQLLSMSGVELLPIPVDEDGISVSHLEAIKGKIKAVYITPSHQFPTGSRLSLERRLRLLQWAKRNHALIIEDDYDGEFRYDVAPLAPLAALSNSTHVVYLGTFSKSMFPSLRIGFLVAHRSLVAQLTAYRSISEYHANGLNQYALAQFIEDGHYERHIFRMRRLYAKKRATLKQAISSFGLPAKINGIESGINARITLENPFSASQLCERIDHNKMGLTPMSRFFLKPSDEDSNIIVGYGAPTTEQIINGIELMTNVIKS